jgi:ubiquinone/menaquinone biosynthesis C-methylase UbiE
LPPAHRAKRRSRQFRSPSNYLYLSPRHYAQAPLQPGEALLPELLPDDTSPASDFWSEWLLFVRGASDAAYAAWIQETLAAYADIVLDGARLAAGETLLDIGAGAGLIAFRAIARIGPSLAVILTDISSPLLRHAKTLAHEAGIAGQCRFLLAEATNLAAIASASVDAVTTRSALAYVADKPAAFREFHRILKPGGRLSIAEPIFTDEALQTIALKITLDGRRGDDPDKFLPLLSRWKSAQFPDTEAKMAANPLTNYTAEDLRDFADAAAFDAIVLDSPNPATRTLPVTWDIFVHRSPHPLARSLHTIMETEFTPEERADFESFLRPKLQPIRPGRLTYLTAQKSTHP